MDLYLGNLADRIMSNGKLQKLFRADIISLGEMLSDKHEIPNMQRPFEWHTNSGKKHVPQLWKDLVEFTEDDSEKEDLYYTGTLICYKEKNKWFVIDGQQRITTLSLLFIAIRDIFDNSWSKHSGKKIKFRGKNLDYKDFSKTIQDLTIGNSKSPRLQPKMDNTKNTNAYRWRMKKEPRSSPGYGIDSPTLRTNQAYIYLKSEIKDKFNSLITHKDIENISSFIDHLLNGVVFNRTTVKDMAQGYRIFSSENTTGLKLNHMDITRALMLAQIDRKSLRKAENKVIHNLARMTKVMAERSTAQKNKFIRSFWVIREGKPLSQSPLLNTMGLEIKKLNIENIEIFALEISKWATKYSHEIIDTLPNMGHYKIHKNLKSCGFSQHEILLLALLMRKGSYKPSDSQLNKILEIVEILYVRYMLVGRLPGNKFETLFAKWANKVYNNVTINSLELIMKGDIAEIEEPAEFGNNFSRLHYKSKSVATYLLSKIELFNTPSLDVISDFENATVERVIPKKDQYSWYIPTIVRNSEWEELYDPSDWADKIDEKLFSYSLVYEKVSKTTQKEVFIRPFYDGIKNCIVENSGPFVYNRSFFEDLTTFHKSAAANRGKKLGKDAEKVWPSIV